MTTAKTRGRETARLAAIDWIEVAKDVLAEQGVDRVSIEPLAKRLGVTKGSFYAHFKDRDDLLSAILENWRKGATLQIIDRIEKGAESPRERFARLLRVPFASGSRSRRGAEIELSIRLWGRSDGRARAALAEVDQLRLAYIGRLLVSVGVPEAGAAARAIQVYSFMRVGAALVDSADETLIARCEADFLS